MKLMKIHEGNESYAFDLYILTLWGEVVKSLSNYHVLRKQQYEDDEHYMS